MKNYALIHREGLKGLKQTYVELGDFKALFQPYDPK